MGIYLSCEGGMGAFQNPHSLKPLNLQNPRLGTLPASHYASPSSPDPSLPPSSPSPLSLVSTSSCCASVPPRVSSCPRDLGGSVSIYVGLSCSANCCSSFAKRPSRSAVGSTRCRVLHSCAKALASRARNSPDSSKRIACPVTLRRSAAVMLSGTCRSTTDLRFFRPPIWPSALALSGLAWKKQSPPEPAGAWHAAPVVVCPLHGILAIG